MKLVSAQIPAWAFLFVAGCLLLFAAGWLFVGSAQSSRWEWADARGMAYLGLLGAALAMLEVCMFGMYGAGAPVSLARGLTATMSMVLLLGAGVWLFKENVSMLQMGGIALAIVGVVMMAWR